MVCFEVVKTSLCDVESVVAAGCSVVEVRAMDVDVVGIDVGLLEVDLVEVNLTEVVFSRNSALPEADVPVIVFWPKMITHSGNC